MSRKFTRSISEVTDVNKLAQHVTTQNDLIQTTEGDVYIVTKNGYEKITGGIDTSDIETINEDVEKLKTDVKNLKSENTKLKNRVTELENASEEETPPEEETPTENDETTE